MTFNPGDVINTGAHPGFSAIHSDGTILEAIRVEHFIWEIGGSKH